MKYLSSIGKSMKGFTLVELMVALFIMMVSTGLLLANYPDSTVRIRLLNNTHKTALLIREAQIRGSAIDSDGSTIGGYGFFINLATPTQAIIFSDSINGVDYTNQAGFRVGDGLYDKSISTTDSIKNTMNLDVGFIFKKICVGSSTANISVAPHGFLCNINNIPNINTLTVSFTRPSQKAYIYINGDRNIEFSSACVQIYSPKTPNVGHVRSIQIYNSGMTTTNVLSCD